MRTACQTFDRRPKVLRSVAHVTTRGAWREAVELTCTPLSRRDIHLCHTYRRPRSGRVPALEPEGIGRAPPNRVA